jgi:hypothetical protein
MQIVCKDCGRTIAGEFVYCPWCGTDQMRCRAPDPVSRFVPYRHTEEYLRIAIMEKTLENLAKDLTELTPKEEMHT